MAQLQHLEALVLRAPLFPQGSRPDFRLAEGAFRLGLRAASPDFLRVLDNTPEGQAPGPKAARTLLKYQLRATERCTPFGSFAGLCLIPIRDAATIQIITGGPETHRFGVQLDSARAWELAKASTCGAASGTRYKPNTSLYRAGQQVRYASAEDSSSGPSYHLSAVEAGPILSELLPAAAQGLAHDELLQLIIGLGAVPEAEAREYLTELIDAQVLLPEGMPPLTGTARIPEPVNPSAVLDDLRQTISEPLQEASFARAAQDLDALIPGRDPAAPDLQVDTFLNCAGAGFPRERIDTITRELAALGALARPYHLPFLERFKARFAARYEGAAVPLLEALDPDLGIGYTETTGAWTGGLLDPLPLEPAAPGPEPAAVRAAPGAPQEQIVAFQSPDTLPGPVAGHSPDTLPGPIVGQNPDTLPGPIVDHQPDTLPGGLRSFEVFSAERFRHAPDTLPGPDTLPAPVIAHQPDTLPGPVTGQAPDTLPGGVFPAPQDPVAGWRRLPDTLPGPVVGHTPDTLPGIVSAERPDTLPGLVAANFQEAQAGSMEPEPREMLRAAPIDAEEQEPRDDTPAPIPASQAATTGAGALQRLVQRKYLESVRMDLDEIVLTDADIQGPGAAWANAVPASFSVLGSLRNAPGDHWRFSLDYAGGATALSLLGRFANGDDAIHALAGEIASMEAAADPGCVLAEIVHLPAPGLGNVSLRPLLRSYEIPYLGVSGAAPERQLDVQDLLLQLHGGELCLFSRRLGRRVLPRLSTAHNFGNNALPVYRLLCELQYQGHAQPAVWDWGAFRDEAFLPAVRYGHLLLKRKSWRLSDAGLDRISAADFDSLRRAAGVPDFVRCGAGDQQLRYDLRNSDEAALLLGELRRDPSLRLEEATPDAAPLVQDAAGQAFANELMIPLLNPEKPPARGYRLLVPEAGVRRSFLPLHDSWHYLRLYCGIATADDILTQGLSAAVGQMLQSGCITQWFFLRYDDGEPQLRVRFRLAEAVRRTGLESAVQVWLQPFAEAGTLHRVSIDTYQRELERYGAGAIEAVERLFGADSDCVVGFLEGSGEAPPEDVRFAFSCCAIDALLDDAGMSPEQRVQVLEPLADAFSSEHGGGVPLQQALNAVFRKQRPRLDVWLNGDAGKYLPEFAALLEQRSTLNRALFSGLDAQPGGVIARLPDLMHMHVNRVFRTGQRRYELLVYHCLLRHYRSRLARAGR